MPLSISNQIGDVIAGNVFVKLRDGKLGSEDYPG